MDISRYSIYPDIVYIWVSPAPTCEFPPLILDYPDIQIIRIRIILDYPGLSSLDNPGYVWIYPDNTRLRNGGGSGGGGGGVHADLRIKLPPAGACHQSTPRAILFMIIINS